MATLQLLAIFAALPVLDWAARWQIENAFAFGMGGRRRVPVMDYWRIGLLLLLGVAAAAIAGRISETQPVAVVAIFLLIAYFARLALSARPTH